MQQDITIQVGTSLEVYEEKVTFVMPKNEFGSFV